jgi:thioesterase domain-containing protein
VVEKAGWGAFRAYRPGSYPGRAHVFICDERLPGFCDPLPVWSRVVCGGMSVELLAGHHDDALGEPNIELLADRLSALLAAA